MRKCPFQFDLFCSDFLPSWLPDETIYSLVGRFARLSGHNTSKTTSKLLFGHPRRGYQHDFAAGLSHLSDIAQGFLGTPEEIALNHSIAPYYLAFASKETRREVLERMAGPRVGALKYSLGLLTSGFRANHPLKGCYECELEDRDKCGTAYWHVRHQLPTVLSCPTHGIPLWVERSKSDGAARFEWLLPDDVPCNSREYLHDSSEPELIGELEALAEITCDLADYGREGELCSLRLQETIRARLDELGYVTPKGSIRRKAAAASYLKSNRSIGQISTLRGLPTDDSGAERQLDRMLRNVAGFKHPIRCVAVLTWLWSSWEEFLANYFSVGRVSIDTDKDVSDAPSDSACLGERLAGLVRSGVSITASAKALDISTSTAQRLAAAEGLPISRRPKLLYPSVQGAIRELAGSGHTKHEIAAATGVSAQSIMRFINTDPELKKRWQLQCRRVTRDAYRAEWTAAIDEAGEAGTKAVRTTAPAAYAWLYRNDRAWLQASTARLEHVKTRITRSIDWSNRDESLAAIIRSKCGLGGSGGELTIPVTLGRLCESVPELRAKLRRLDDLPKTAQTLSQVVRR